MGLQRVEHNLATIQQQYIHIYIQASNLVLVVKNPLANAGDIRDTNLIPGPGRFPEEGMATHSSILA